MESETYKNSQTRLKLFRALKKEGFEISQSRENSESGTVKLEVQLATIKI